MNTSMIRDLYLGNIDFSLNNYKQVSPELKAALKKMTELEKQRPDFGPREAAWLEEYSSTAAEIEALNHYEVYSEALKFGALLMAEVIMDHKSRL